MPDDADVGAVPVPRISIGDETIVLVEVLRAELDAVLVPGETPTELIEASVRRAVEFRRVQTDFATRCDASLAAYERNGISIPADAVLSKIEATVRQAVEYRRMQAEFDARANTALARFQQTGAAVPAEEVVAEMREQLEARRRELQGKCRPA